MYFNRPILSFKFYVSKISKVIALLAIFLGVVSLGSCRSDDGRMAEPAENSNGLAQTQATQANPAEVERAAAEGESKKKLADSNFRNGKYKESIAAAEKAIQSFNSAGDTYDWYAGECFGIIGDSYVQLKDSSKALTAYDRCTTLLDSYHDGGWTGTLIPFLKKYAALLRTSNNLPKAKEIDTKIAHLRRVTNNEIRIIDEELPFTMPRDSKGRTLPVLPSQIKHQ